MYCKNNPAAPLYELTEIQDIKKQTKKVIIIKLNLKKYILRNKRNIHVWKKKKIAVNLFALLSLARHRSPLLPSNSKVTVTKMARDLYEALCAEQEMKMKPNIVEVLEKTTLTEYVLTSTFTWWNVEFILTHRQLLEEQSCFECCTISNLAGVQTLDKFITFLSLALICSYIWFASRIMVYFEVTFFVLDLMH